MQVEKNISSKEPFIIDINQEGGEEGGPVGMEREVVKKKMASTEKTKIRRSWEQGKISTWLHVLYAWL